MESSTITDQKVNLVEGEFTAAEAKDVISALIDEKINFHKLQRLSWWEHDLHANTNFPDGRIQELQQEKENFKAYINSLGRSDVKLRIDGKLIVSIVD